MYQLTAELPTFLALQLVALGQYVFCGGTICRQEDVEVALQTGMTGADTYVSPFPVAGDAEHWGTQHAETKTSAGAMHQHECVFEHVHIYTV